MENKNNNKMGKVGKKKEEKDKQLLIAINEYMV